MKNPVAIFAFLMVVLLAILTFKVYQYELTSRQLNDDRVVLNHISYGLFNIDEWKTIVTEILTLKIDEFEVTDANRDDVRKKAEEIMHAVIDEVELLTSERNKKSVSGILKQFFADLVFSFDELRKEVPQYAAIIVDRLDNPETKEGLKAWMLEKINNFADETVGEMDYSAMNEVLSRYNAPDRETCMQMISASRQDVKILSRTSVFVLAAIVIALLILMWMVKNRSAMVAFCIAAALLLFAGVSLPMIDIEATITHFAFSLIGEPVEFNDQVLFFQSKSILEVVQLLLVNGEPALIVVAFLVFAFSVLVPVSKLIMSLIALTTQRLPKTKFGRFILFRSGKWSMADVMVVALFMAYIGFSGVINNQLTQIERGNASLEVFTTNNSTLRLGFYLFTAYALSGLVLSERIKLMLRTPE